MRWTIPLLCLGLLSACHKPTPAAPHVAKQGGGIVSLNPCADALLVELAPSRRIAAISHYSHDPNASSLPQEVALRFPATSGTAEEVIAMRPSLVLASSFTPPAMQAALRRANVPMLLLDSPTSVAASRTQIKQVADTLGEHEAGRALIARIDRVLEHAVPRSTPRVPALIFLGGNLASGGGTLLDELLTRAGFRDAASDYGLDHTGSIPLETLVAKPPRVVFAPSQDNRAGAARREALQHSGSKVTYAEFPRALMNCGGPTIIPAIQRLAAVRDQLDK